MYRTLITMFCIFFFMVTFVSWSEEHLAFPINYCNVAVACIHDSRPVCATSLDGCSRRSFLDQCDMFEYNCDFDAHYTTTVTTTCVHDYIMDNCEAPKIENVNSETKCSPPQISEMYTNTKEYFYSIYKMTVTKICESTTTTSQPLSIEILHKSKEESIAEATTSKSNCNRPMSWGTTLKGETRDFFRVLRDDFAIRKRK